MVFDDRIARLQLPDSADTNPRPLIVLKIATKGGYIMIVVNFSTVRRNFKDFCDKVTDGAETVIVTRKAEKNVVIISAERYSELEKAERNAAYLKKARERDCPSSRRS